MRHSQSLKKTLANVRVLQLQNILQTRLEFGSKTISYVQENFQNFRLRTLVALDICLVDKVFFSKHWCLAGYIITIESLFAATESEISRSSAVSSKDSKKNKDKSKAPKTGDLNVEENFDNGFKTSQSLFLPDIKLGIEE